LLLSGRAWSHPHRGGLVVAEDGTIWLGDVSRSRLTTLATDGSVRHRGDLGHVRALALDSAGRLWGASQSHGIGLWRLEMGGERVLVEPQFNGLFALDAADRPALAAADSMDHRPALRLPGGGERRFEQIEAIAWDGNRFLVVDAGTLRSVAPDGDARELATGTDVVIAGTAVLVLEHSSDCCIGGPRLRRFAEGKPVETLFMAEEPFCGVSLDALRCDKPSAMAADAAPPPAQAAPVAPAGSTRPLWSWLALVAGLAVAAGLAVRVLRN
jgi:hypothetical protein